MLIIWKFVKPCGSIYCNLTIFFAGHAQALARNQKNEVSFVIHNLPVIAKMAAVAKVNFGIFFNLFFSNVQIKTFMKIESLNKAFLFWYWRRPKKFFFRNKTFLFLNIKSWNFQHLFENEVRETSQNFNFQFFKRKNVNNNCLN